MLSGSCPAVVIGTGSIGFRHLRVLNQGLSVPAFALPIRESRIPELEALGFPACRTLQEAVRRGATCAVIASDTGRHIADALNALSLDCHILVEKPLSASCEGLRDLEALARLKGRKVFVGCTLRFDRALLLFRERLAEIGTLHAVRIECQSYLPDWRPDRDYRSAYCARTGEGGVLLDLIHDIDYAVWLFGAPAGVFAKLANTGRLGIATEEMADLFWNTRHGAAVSIRLDYLSRRAHRVMRAYGDQGEIEWDGVAKTVTVTRAGQPSESVTLTQERDDIMTDQSRAFLAAISGGDPASLATLEQGGVAMAICDAARRSSASGCVESVQDWRK